MTTEVQNAADLIDKWAAKLTNTVEQHGPAAADLAMTLGQIGAFQTIGFGFLKAAIAVGGFIVIRKLALQMAKLADEGTDAGFPLFIGAGVGVVIGGIITIGMTIDATISLTNAYAWVGMFRPEVFLAAKALGL